MYIECPSCAKDNKIEFGENILCRECKCSFAGHSYKKVKKPLISVTTALIFGAFGAHNIDKVFFEEQRYPVNIEYELIDNCINSSRPLISSYRYNDKATVCVCALEKTMKVISYDHLKKSEPDFLAHFRRNVSSCL
ncbi:hypothetical protein [Aeromonas hydrophila]|uniref:hypothetical protein n=1 Tax=Aeromonas hydrophila TaxID=644 RepID=UPI001058F4D3|nr:hypothetical protein [Aeromonas hydrophila]MBC8669866.1 hypothetical protein [Aeromonas hydrophila]MBC8687484.1 hypothetical protein [Aeromonas hydrophila]MBQ4677886.1 hypothetical protein [Aeromonas hydrophila]MBW3815028.1 hypothetical protein [Aeromonas hydrophila]MCF7677464.1 hypothetical protein [Aeromonas hydrophila]